MSDRRRYLRTQLTARVLVRHEAIGEVIYSMRDLSDGGIYVVVEEGNDFPELGAEVEVQAQGLPIEAPVRKMRVVRKDVDGYGLEFLDEQE